jgi:hypothetical protein
MFPNPSKIAYRQEFQSSWSTSHRSCLCDSDFSSSLGLFLLVLGASELLVYLICKRMACYADNAFNSQGLDWTTSSESHEQPHTKNLKRSMIKKWLKLSKYFTSGQEEDFCCPICLGDYGKLRLTVDWGPLLCSYSEPFVPSMSLLRAVRLYINRYWRDCS